MGILLIAGTGFPQPISIDTIVRDGRLFTMTRTNARFHLSVRCFRQSMMEGQSTNDCNAEEPPSQGVTCGGTVDRDLLPKVAAAVADG
jgi:hypothetical protein